MRTLTIVALLAALAAGASSQVIFGGGRFATPQPQQNNDPPGSLSGHVVNAVTGEPVRGATINLVNYTGGGRFQSVTTDAAGTFAAANLTPGDYYVQVTHPGYQGIMGLSNPSQMVTVASSQDSSGVTLRLMPGGTISGKVVDDGGEPAPGCGVWALGPGQGANPARLAQKGSASTNDKGEYRFDALIADRYVVYVRCQESLPVERPLAAWRGVPNRSSQPSRGCRLSIPTVCRPRARNGSPCCPGAI
jgi:5-hydroxyisourate hydrolase-like protein (transthyretin family)